MEYLELPVWKEELRAGRTDPAFAAKVGATLAAIHSATAGRSDVAARFPTDAIFYAIRLEPYLVATGNKYKDIQQRMSFLAERTAKTKLCLVHGDVSPKNILIGPAGPVFLDAECAWYGDPAFDLAFCLNHLLLKSVARPQATLQYANAFQALKEAYLGEANWEMREHLDARAVRLLGALLLARVDGKSPVEYLTDEVDRQRIRDAAIPLVASAPQRFDAIASDWRRAFAAKTTGD
jgi:aminoglycoside phosphotransferase (APT) family kinase protein